MGLRADILQILLENEKPLGAYDIARQVSQIKGRKCYANSIYRVLGAMVRSGVVQSIATTRSFFVAAPQPRALLWCICQNCKVTHPVDAEAIHGSLAQAAKTQNFRPSKVHVELIGLCADCADTAGELTL